ncbi:MAG: aminoglycoside phosphotransferase family protein [Chloroflexota bacterium]|nr:aminoglycoside phosphotransferase family protein [Chloroflexota bacterium]
MGTKQYSTRLGAIRDAQFRAALGRLGLGEFVRAEPVTGGLFGQNVFVTSTQGEWVLRGAPHYDWQLPSERFFARLLHERTSAPVPWPYMIDPAEDIFGWSYAVMPRMPGLQPGGAELPPADRLGMARAMAENLALVHELAWPVAGTYDLATDTIAPITQSWEDWVAAEVREWLALALGHSDRTTDADVGWVEHLLRAARAALGEPSQPRIVLRDYKENNTVMSRTADGWRVSGVFDLMEASFGDAEMDLVRQTALYLDEDARLARGFLRTYLGLWSPRPGFEGRFPVYMLRDRLIVWEYFQRPGTEPPWDARLTLREWAEPYTTSLGAQMG